MTNTLLGRGQFGPWLWAIAIVVGGLSIACQDRSSTVRPGADGSDTRAQAAGASNGTDTLPPRLANGCPPNRPPQTEKELDACVGNLEFDTLEEAGDKQRLLVVNQGGSPCPANPRLMCRHGPLARIEPLKNAHKFRPEQLQEGRIIARLSITNGQEGYPKLNLAPGHKTYWWVQRNASGLGGSSVLVSDSVEAGKVRVSKPQDLEVKEVPEGTFKQALARWLWSEDDETAKGTCGSASCKR